MNMVRLPSGISDTDKIGKPVQQDQYFESNGKGIQSNWKFDVLTEFLCSLNCAIAEELRNKMKIYKVVLHNVTLDHKMVMKIPYG